MEALTKTQQKIFDFIKKAKLEKGYSPSYREICQGVGLKSVSTVHEHISNLQKKGYIKRSAAKSRTIEIVDESYVPIKHEMVNIPIVGKVAAGQPLLAVENIEDYFPVPIDYLSSENKELFMVKVQGESMINLGIMNGDFLIVRQQLIANDNDIVVALIDDSVTCKIFFKEDNRYRLQPANDTMEPIYTDSVTILGKVIGSYRMY